MSARTATCPNCGAAARFRWSGAVQTVCDYCRSILVRRDLDLERVGFRQPIGHLAVDVEIGFQRIGDEALGERNQPACVPHEPRLARRRAAPQLIEQRLEFRQM